jgi:penicillin-binding protein 1A
MKKMKSNFSKYILGMWLTFAGLLVLGALFFWMVSIGLFGFMPSFEDLENPKNQVASQIISADGKLLGKFFKDENRTLIKYENLNPFLVQALVATEDERFYRHSGVDVQGLFRVVKGLLSGDTSSGGGSTLSQQLAKLLFPRESGSGMKLVMRKFREWIIAIKLERSYTKEEIITMYLNKFEFIHGAFGVNVASRTYFNSTPDSLKLHQSAMLVGMLKNPWFFNPTRNEERALQRRNVVLYQMVKNRFISRDQFDSLKVLPLDLDFQRDEIKQGIAPYFRKYLERNMIAKKPERSDYSRNHQRYYEDSLAWQNDPLYGWCNKNKKPDGETYDLYKDGLKIYSTVDYRMQEYAEQSVREHLMRLQPELDGHVRKFKNAPFSDDLSEKEVKSNLLNEIKRSGRYKPLVEAGLSVDEIFAEFSKPDTIQIFSWKGYKDTIMSPLDSIRYYLRNLSSSFMAMEPASGHVKAWVGGSAYGYTEIDMVRTFKRQVGSTCKPFIYTLGMLNGLTPCKMVPNVEQSFPMDDGSTWTARNSSRDPANEGKMVSLRWGLAHSVNQVSAWLMKEYNPNAMLRIMRRMGIYSDVPAVYSMFLGTAEISLYEMVASYAVYANRGVYTTPIVVTRIEDKDGNLLATFEPRRHDALDEKTAYLMINLLQNVVREGSGIRLITKAEKYKDYGGFPVPFAGKTGTTQKQSDGWFVGFSPDLVAGAWTGANYRSIRFTDMSRGQGSNMALPVFGRFFKKVFADPSLPYSEHFEFTAPNNFNIDLNCNDRVDQSDKQDEDYSEFF